jgi:stearoyl-CoA 9-desaturase NADPH oxidoreductase
MLMRGLSRFLSSVVSPPVFDFWAQRIDRTAAWDRCLARVVARRPASADAVTLTLAPNRHFRGFRPGQHLNLTAEVDGRAVTRSYSPCSAPRADGRFEITVRRVQDGRLSARLCDGLERGDVVEVGAAFGDLDWRDSPHAPHVFFAAGSGITPLMGLLRAALAQGITPQLDLVYWASRREQFCFAEDLRAIARASAGRVRVHFVVTREAPLQAGEPHGRPSADLLARLVPDASHRAALACGPDGFVRALRPLLPAANLQAESFTPAAPQASVTGSVRVRLARSRRTLELAAGQSLLEGLEAQGLRPAHGCRMGLCNTCACAKLGGTTQDLASGLVDAEPSAALRLCVNRPASDLILDL